LESEHQLTWIVYGMGIDLGSVLSLMGTVWTGNPLSLDPGFSIGGESSKVTNFAENLLGLGLLGGSLLESGG
jgi:hypothetical protein